MTVDHRSSDTDDLHIERKVPLPWLLGIAGVILSGGGAWAWNTSITLNNVSRDLALATKTLERLDAGQSATQTELIRGASRDEAIVNRMTAIELRMNGIESKIEARQAARQPLPP